MNKRPELDTENPPGQIVNRPPIRYLRDVIRKYYEEETAQEPPLVQWATQVSNDAEKRLERLKTALLGYCEELDKWHSGWATTCADEIRQLVEKA